ncbi:MAG: aminotransferase class III-fold pyridoxal phosphate-dependent enzyme [Nitrosopumilus sp.]|nr:aminotransferase class III-fold pyridoxal phosphate-dependent enzyme [Nitrosopumilus sp.]MDF2423490.1 aminotransferase class III-fold pyridoxal phosphate-dependent enzyme [Nitrosopumilus sp.]MDF2424084.1 aminotransferase class III-fold pyridoxal phosphate-dependent enzyme [Nitrosopumilus sp.]MDF2424984.1 aminotransferase class III-fold pyridoxal phosphate-dependent enzyme [Nitrosopumilus sp.]MDF2427426.1 aminotransferase class III-fold pyridoxal phosphate-dependent enzyme [Nitrosopumilus sp.
MLLDYITEYKKKTKNSARLFAKSLKLHVNGVSHNIRYYEPYPFVVKSSGGKSLTDVDDNKYTDYWMGHWSLILGHAPSKVKDSLKKQIEKSWMYGTVNEQTIRLSELISKAVPVAEKIRYVTSGTEATMYAVRLARSVTGRKIIAKIDGGWHGYTSDLLKSVNWPFTESESSGVVNEEKIVSIPYNDLEGSLQILKKHSKDLAGVIIEPVLGGAGCIPATQDYLRGIQEFVHKNKSLFILDEIVTGFRFRYGCLYPTMKLDPDIVTLGKIVGGGMAIGVMCGKKEIMEHSNTVGKKKSERSYVGGGTFSANPSSMTTGYATLSVLKNGKSIYSKINGLGEYARKELSKSFDGKVIVTGKGSLFMTHFTKGGITEVTNAAQASMCDVKALHEYHFKMIAHDGIFFLPGKLGAISNAHEKSDIKKMIQ